MTCDDVIGHGVMTSFYTMWSANVQHPLPDIHELPHQGAVSRSAKFSMNASPALALLQSPKTVPARRTVTEETILLMQDPRTPQKAVFISYLAPGFRALMTFR
jgi:hypothetical protein